MKPGHLLFSAFLFVFSLSAGAQPFVPDVSGHVNDTAFSRLITERGYKLVGSYGPVRKRPGLIAAMAVRDSTAVYLDLNGAEIPYEHEEDWKEEPAKKTPARFTVFFDGGKSGIKNTDGAIVVPARYDKIVVLKTSGFTVQLGSQWGLLADDGTELVRPQYVNIVEHDEVPGILTFSQDGRVGIMTAGGKIIRAPHYKKLFYDRRLMQYGKMLIISDSLGKTTYGILDLRTGKEVLPPVYSSAPTHFSGSLFRTSVGPVSSAAISTRDNRSLHGLISLSQNREVLPPKYSMIYEQFNGRCALRIFQGSTDEGLFGMADTNGKVLIPVVYNDLDLIFPAGWGVAGKNGNYGVLDLQNRYLIEPEYEYLESNWMRDPSDDNSHAQTVIFSINRRYGAMTIGKKRLVEPIYNSLKFTKGGFIAIMERKYGVISETGAVMLPVEYDRISDTGTRGIYRVEKAGKMYRADLYGHFVEQIVVVKE